MVTEPLELRKALTPLRRQMDVVPLVDMVLLAIMFMLLGSHFVVAPGVGIELSEWEGLPTSASSKIPGSAVVDVLTVKNTDSILFRGKFYSIGDFDRSSARPELMANGGVLLVRVNSSVQVGVFFRIADWARTAGFDRVQLAGRGRVEPEVADAVADGPLSTR